MRVRDTVYWSLRMMVYGKGLVGLESLEGMAIGESFLQQKEIHVPGA